MLHITPEYIFSRPVYEYLKPRTRHILPSDPRMKKPTGKGMSVNSKRKIKRSGQWLAKSGELVGRHLSFMTLTYSSKEKRISDYKIKRKLLKPFIKRMHYNVGAFQYIWRIEKHKNGNTHVHMLTDSFINWKVINTNWNQLLHKNGLQKHYLEEHGNIYAPSTDVKSIKGGKGVARYISKYISKGGDTTRNLGRMWGRSYTLARACKKQMFIDVTNEDPVLDMLDKLRKKEIENDGFVIGIVHYFKKMKQLPAEIESAINSCLWSFRHRYTLFDKAINTT